MTHSTSPDSDALLAAIDAIIADNVYVDNDGVAGISSAAEAILAALPHRSSAGSAGDDDLLERLDDQGLYSKAERIQMIKDAAAEIRRLRSVAQASWQPIETAPHEKRVLLGWYDWRDHQWCVEVGPATTGQRFGNGYSNLSQHGSATHWHPLPTPPVSSTVQVCTHPDPLTGLPATVVSSPNRETK